MIQFLLVTLFFRVIRSSRLKWRLNRHLPRAFFLPRMTHEEFGLLAAVAEPAKVIVEYGSGGSTVFFLRKAKTVISVDSNPEFHRFMMSIPYVSTRVGNGLNLDFVDIGPTDTWGTPLTTDRSSEWPRYVEQVWTRIDPNVDRVDLVLIDGRFRVACCLYSIQKLIEYGWSATLLLIHDFRDRKEYHVVLPFLTEVRSAGTLGVFRIRDDVDLSALRRLLEEYEQVPR